MPRLFTSATTGALTIAALVYACATYRSLPASPADYRDFNAYYIPALAIRHGIDPYSASFRDLYAKLPEHPLGPIDASGEAHFGDAPTWLTLFVPLTLLPVRAAYWTWQAISASALFLAIIVCLHELDFRGGDSIALGALMLMYGPIAQNIWFGQSELLLLLILTLMIAALRRGYDLAGGLLLALAVLARAYPLGLLAYLLVRRRWAAIGYTIAGIVAGGIATIAYTGLPTARSFIEATGLLHGAGLNGSPPLHQAIGFIKHPCNLNLGWAVRWLFDRTGLHPSLAANIAAAAGEIALLAAAFAATARIDPEDRDLRGFSLWMVTVTLISPIAWVHFLACFVPVFIAVAAAARDRRLPGTAAWLAFASYALITSWPRPDGVAPVIIRFSESLTRNSHIIGMLAEVVPVSLGLIWLAAWSWNAEAGSAAVAPAQFASRSGALSVQRNP